MILYNCIIIPQSIHLTVAMTQAQRQQPLYKNKYYMAMKSENEGENNENEKDETESLLLFH